MESQAQTSLIHAAMAARGNAHAPYSHFPVGAAVLTASGETFVGCNVENVSYGLTICAERAALFAAVAAGHKQLAALAVATAGGHAPCGACRQVLSEFQTSVAAPIEIVLIDADDPTHIRTTTLNELLPAPFRL